MKKILLFLFLSVPTFCFSQKANKLIKEDEVVRIIKTLSADDMLGRSALHPEHIEKATLFIEQEFKNIGLTPIKGLSGYRQEFAKERVAPGRLNVLIDNQSIPEQDVVLVSEQTDISIKSGLTIQSIPHDSTVANKDQYFFDKAFAFARDTTSELILVAPQFQNNFREFKGFFGKRFVNGRKSTKVFVLGKATASSYSIFAKQKTETIKMANVVGVLEGKTKPDEMVVFSGHYDHIGIQQRKIANDSIANGANDDASGTTAVIELARYFKKVRNNRTLIFVAFTAEEIGGYGSKYFSQQLDPEKVVAMFNIEMIGKPSKWGQNFAFITGYERSDFGTILQKNLAGTPFQFKPDPYPEQNLFYRSDNATLARLGVPAHTICTDQIDIDKLYHTVDDEFESIDIKTLTAIIRAIALSSKSIVEGTDTPKRIDKTTVR